MQRGITLWLNVEQAVDNLKRIGALKENANEEDVKSAISTAVTLTQHTSKKEKDNV